MPAIDKPPFALPQNMGGPLPLFLTDVAWISERRFNAHLNHQMCNQLSSVDTNIASWLVEYPAVATSVERFPVVGFIHCKRVGFRLATAVIVYDLTQRMQV